MDSIFCNLNELRKHTVLTVINTKKKQLPGEETMTTTVPLTTVTSVANTTVETSSAQTKSTSKSSTVTKVTTTVNTGDKLPQTGQLWWPIPILSIAGMVFLSTGLAMRSKDPE